MESLYLLIPGALIFIAIAVKILFWAINNGQYDNLDTEAHRILFDDEKINHQEKTNDSDVEVKIDELKNSSTPTNNKHD